MVKKKTIRFWMTLIPCLVLLFGVACLLWTHDVTVVLVHIRRPGTSDILANSAALHYASDTYVAGWICIAAVLGWWLLLSWRK